MTYFIPQDGVWSERLIPMEATNMENSHVLLFVIKDDSRSLSDMILVSDYRLLPNMPKLLAFKQLLEIIHIFLWTKLNLILSLLESSGVSEILN